MALSPTPASGFVIDPSVPLQAIWPSGTCYGCGPANPQGLHIQSFWRPAANPAGVNEVICTFHPQPQHNAGFDNVMYGGLLASLCDCHSIWAAIAFSYHHENREYGSVPTNSYVTGNLNVSFLAPTPLNGPVVLRSRLEELGVRKAIIRTMVHAGALDGPKTVEARVTAVRFNQDKSLGATTT